MYTSIWGKVLASKPSSPDCACALGCSPINFNGRKVGVGWQLTQNGFWLIVTTKEWNMRQTTGTHKSPGEKIVKDIKRATRKQYLSD